jgi:hypothetical protein
LGIDRAHYHGWQGKLGSPWLGSAAIVRVGLLQVFRRKLYWIVIAAGLLQFLVFFALIYATTQFGEFREQILERINFSARAGTDTENGYLLFMQRQSVVVMILLAFSGSLLVGSDFRLKALPFYLSRRIDRRHYIAGKLLAVSAVVALMTIVPALALFIEYGAFTSSFAYWFENWRLVVSILGYGFVLCAVLSILLVALSAWLQRTAPIAITWSSIFTMLTFVAERMREFTRNNYWTLLDVWRDMRYVGRSFFGYYPREEDRELAWWALAILLGLCTAALIALVHRVRAVDVVE